jgi:hypothetical protein
VEEALDPCAAGEILQRRDLSGREESLGHLPICLLGHDPLDVDPDFAIPRDPDEGQSVRMRQVEAQIATLCFEIQYRLAEPCRTESDSLRRHPEVVTQDFSEDTASRDESITIAREAEPRRTFDLGLVENAPEPAVGLLVDFEVGQPHVGVTRPESRFS